MKTGVSIIPAMMVTSVTVSNTSKTISSHDEEAVYMYKHVYSNTMSIYSYITVKQKDYFNLYLGYLSCILGYLSCIL